MNQINKMTPEEMNAHIEEHTRLYVQYTDKILELRDEWDKQIKAMCEQYKAAIDDVLDVNKNHISENVIYYRINHFLDIMQLERADLTNTYLPQIQDYLKKLLDLDVIKVGNKIICKSFYLDYNISDKNE